MGFGLFGTKTEKWENVSKIGFGACSCVCVCLLLLLLLLCVYFHTVAFADRNLSSTELESGNAIGAFLKTPAPALDKNYWAHGCTILSSTGLGLATS